MSLERYSAQGRNQRPAWLPLAVSAAVHGVGFLFLVNTSLPRMPEKAKNEYQQVILGKEKQIVWYRFKKDLPDVSPVRSASESKRPLKAEVKAKQAMIASPKNAPKREQMVWSPAPELLHTQPVESPNLLAIKMPEPPPPAPDSKPVKPFVAPPDIVHPPAPRVAPLPDAPVLRADAAKPAALPEMQRPAKPFTAPPVHARAMPRREISPLENAPELRAKMSERSLKIAELPKPMRRYVPPPAVRPAPKALVNTQPLPDAPDLTASFDSTLPEVFHVPMAKPSRPFRAPPAAGGGRHQRTIQQVEAPPEMARGEAPGVAGGSGVLLNRSMPTPPAIQPPAMQGNSKELNMAVVGLNPTDKAALPANSSAAEFSAGPVVRKDGATSTGDSKGLSVPDMFVRGAKDAKPDLIARAYAPVTSPENLREAMRHSGPGSRANQAEPVPMKMNGAIQVSSAPDPRFQGRDVFMMAIQMPNLTSYSGSWLMWYAERDARQQGLGAIAPPVAYRKVDPKYIATAVQERVQGRVQLACVIKRDGSVAGVQLVRGVDDRLNRSAQEALSKWEFSPAMRNGQAVDVDVIVEIPFQLAPKVKGPY